MRQRFEILLLLLWVHSFLSLSLLMLLCDVLLLNARVRKSEGNEEEEERKSFFVRIIIRLLCVCYS